MRMRIWVGTWRSKMSRYIGIYPIMYNSKAFFLLRGGGGGGVHPDYFVNLDFEIAVDQQTRARD